ncbi:MAG: site-2 protease family protein [Planctomycetaceae bacterium]|jgi:Zn-dependent protease|nr:site-2 protease family protein [Planctomycetaceae bacterium]
MHQPTPYDINFNFYGFPIRINPLFWVVITLLGMPREITNLSVALLELAIWVLAAFVSILVHELGHALVFRHVYRVPSQIIFYGMGGATIPFMPHQRRYGFKGLLYEIFLFAAGPLAGFVLAGCFSVPALFIFLAINRDGQFFFNEGLGVAGLSVLIIIASFMQMVIIISILWGIFNLLPIYPMDGGHISREIFSFFSFRNGVANSLILSMITAIIFALLAFRFGQPFMAILFAYFAYQNYQELSYGSFRRW